MNSWAVSACYPRSTFYPLSDGPSMWNRRITMARFRVCPACAPRSQAGFCHCTHLTVSDRDEPTFALLRYSLGGDRPSQTSRQTRSAGGSLRALEPQTCQGGISRTAPGKPEFPFHSLPPILRRQARGSVSSCSKGSHGYTIRAGRNLPDKEFRYLRTVIVTAAVYRGFTRERRVSPDSVI